MRTLLFPSIGACFLAVAVSAQEPGACIIETIAGGGTTVFGDGGTALEAELFEPEETAIGPDGSLYIADTKHDAIRRVGPDGVIRPVAGTGEPGFSGDGGPATDARIDSPGSMAFGPDGSLYFSDNGNWRIRRVRGDGIVETVVGSGRVLRFDEELEDNTPALETPLGSTHIAFDGDGNLVLSVEFQHRIRRLRADGRVETIAGTDPPSSRRDPGGDGLPAVEAVLDRPLDIAIGPDHSIVFADDAGGYVRRIAPDGIIGSFAGRRGGESNDGTPLDQGSVGSTISLVFDSDGRFVWRSLRRGVRRVTSDGVIETLFAEALHGISISPDGAIFGLYRERALRWNGEELTPTAGIGRTATRGDGGQATAAHLSDPLVTEAGLSGEVYILDRLLSRVRVVEADGRIRNFAGTGEFGLTGSSAINALEAPLANLQDLAIAPDGSLLIAMSSQVARVTQSGVLTLVVDGASRSDCRDPRSCGDGGPVADADIGRITKIEADSKGNVYLLENIGREGPPPLWIRRIRPDGIIETLPFRLPNDRAANSVGAIEVDANDDLLISTGFSSTSRLWVHNLETGWSGLEPAQGFVLAPTSMAASSDGTLIYSSASHQSRIRAYSPDGRVNAIAGRYELLQGFSGDGGPALEAALGAVNGISLDEQGNIYFADRFNHRVRRISRALDCPRPSRPLLAIGGAVNSASYSTSLAPGSIFSLFGRGMGPSALTVAAVENGSFPSSLDGVRVLIDGAPAPLLFVSDGQVSGIVPNATPIGVERNGNTTIIRSSSTLEVEYDAVRSEPNAVQIAAAAPAIFSLDQSGAGQGAILNEDGTVNGPDNPARPGSIIVIFGTGGGLLDPPGEDGRLATAPFGQTVFPVTFRADRIEGEVLYAGEAPGLVSGVLQVNARLPESLARRGAVEIDLTAGGFRSQFSLTVFVGE